MKERRGKKIHRQFSIPILITGWGSVASKRGRTGGGRRRDKGRGARVRHVRFLRSFSFQRFANVLLSSRVSFSISLSFFVREAT